MSNDATPDDEPPVDTGGFQPVIDGGELPKFEPTFELRAWDTPEGPVLGVPYEEAEVPTPEDRIAYVRSAMAGPNR